MRLTKGQSTIPFTVIEGATTMLILLSIAYGTQVETNDFVKSETLDLQVDRVTNAALSLNSIPKGHIEVKMEGYGLKYENGNITMNYSNSKVSKSIADDELANYEGGIEGPSTFKTTEGNVCLSKTREDKLIIEVADC